MTAEFVPDEDAPKEPTNKDIKAIDEDDTIEYTYVILTAKVPAEIFLMAAIEHSSDYHWVETDFQVSYPDGQGKPRLVVITITGSKGLIDEYAKFVQLRWPEVKWSVWTPEMLAGMEETFGEALSKEMKSDTKAPSSH